MDCFGVIGNDIRMRYLYESLRLDGYNTRFATPDSADALICDCNVIILPVNSEDIAKKCKGKTVFGGFVNGVPEVEGAKVYNYLTNGCYTVKNALATAEGAIAVAMNNTDSLICDRKIAITGYGNIAKVLCKMLLSLGCDVTVCARNELQRANAEVIGAKACDIFALPLVCPDIIFNTVPATVITQGTLSVLSDDAIIIELASAPGGVDKEVANRLGVTIISAQGLPGKYAPKYAGEILKEAVLLMYKEV